MPSLKTRLATVAIAACGVGYAAAQTALIVPLEASGDYGYSATGPYGPAPEAILVVPESAVVIVPGSSAPASTAWDQGGPASAPQTSTMGAGPHTGAMGAAPEVNRRGEPLASTTEASTSLRPDVFDSADGSPSALGGGTRLSRGYVRPADLPPAMDASGRILRGNAQ